MTLLERFLQADLNRSYPISERKIAIIIYSLISGCFQINSKLVTTTGQITRQSRQLANKLRRPLLSPTNNSVNILNLVFKYKDAISDDPPMKVGANIHPIFI